MPEKLTDLFKEEVGLLREQNKILVQNTIFTGASCFVAVVALVIAVIALIK